MFKNNLLSGILCGFAAPVIAFMLFNYVLHNEAIIMDKPAVPYLIAIGLNLVLLRYFFKKDMLKTANGVMVITFVCTLLVFIFKMQTR